MKRRSLKLFSLFLSLPFLLIVAIGCATTKSKEIKENFSVSRYPTGYQDWSNTFSKIIPDKTSPFYGFQRVLVSKKALASYKNGRKYPQGSQLVLEFSELIPEGYEGEDIKKGPVNWIAVMTKDSSATKTDGWVYEVYDGNPIAVIKRDMNVVMRCYDCHTAMKHKDYVFSSLPQK